MQNLISLDFVGKIEIIGGGKKLFTVDQEGRVIETKMIMMEESKNVKREEKKKKCFAAN